MKEDFGSLMQQARVMRVRYLGGLLRRAKPMRSTGEGRRVTRAIQTAATPSRREVRATSRAAVTGRAGAVALVLLFLVTAGYLVFGGRHEAAATAELKSSISAFGAAPAHAGDAQPNESTISGACASFRDYFPSA